MNNFRKFLIEALSRDYYEARIDFHHQFMACSKHWRNNLIFSTRLGLDFFRETLRIFDNIDAATDALTILRLSGIHCDPILVDKMEWDWAELIRKHKNIT